MSDALKSFFETKLNRLSIYTNSQTPLIPFLNSDLMTTGLQSLEECVHDPQRSIKTLGADTNIELPDITRPNGAIVVHFRESPLPQVNFQQVMRARQPVGHVDFLFGSLLCVDALQGVL